MFKKLKRILFIALGIYLLVLGFLYVFQENLIFHPQKLPKDYSFEFGNNIEELNFQTQDGKLINGIVFKTQDPKGLIFYLHGNAGSLKSWGSVAQFYNYNNYDVFILDYRGYGKSEGKIISESQLHKDNLLVYNELKQRYNESKMIILGYSIGTGMASQLASENNPKLLILQAPYYSLTNLVQRKLPIIPRFILKYKLETHRYLEKCKMPVVLFHGTDDQVINYSSSGKLEKEFKPGDTLITLEGAGHNGMTENLEYQKAMKIILNEY